MAIETTPESGVLPVLSHWINGTPIEVMPENTGPIYNPATGTTSPEPLHDIYRFIPARVVHFRVFSLNHDHDGPLAQAAERVLNAAAGAARPPSRPRSRNGSGPVR